MKLRSNARVEKWVAVAGGLHWGWGQRRDASATLLGLLLLFLVQCGWAADVLVDGRAAIYRSLDKGLTWHAFGDGVPGTAQGSFVAPYQEGLVFASDNVGVFVRQKGEASWTSIGEGLPGQKINALFTDEEWIWVGVFQHGLFRTADWGRSWKRMRPAPPDARIHAALRLGATIVLGADSGMYRLSPGAENWEQTLAGDQVVSLHALDGLVVAGTTSGVTVSSDLGQTWQWVHQDGALHTTAVVGGVIFAMYISGDLFLSKDSGASWVQAKYAPSQGSYVYALVKAGGELLLSNNYGIHSSRDGGSTWSLIYHREDFGFFGLYVDSGVIYGAVRDWKERRGPAGPFDLDLEF